jgi:hypothetical protein
MRGGTVPGTLVAAIFVAVWLTGADAMATERPVVRLATATPGGGFPVYGEALAATVNEADDSLEVRTQHTKGGRAAALWGGGVGNACPRRARRRPPIRWPPPRGRS